MNNVTIPTRVPDAVFKVRVPDPDADEQGATKWADLTTDEIFAGKKVVFFALPGAFTPTCSSVHLPEYEEHYDEFMALGVDDVVCLSVNDAHVMNAWASDKGITKVRLVPDGSGVFTEKMGMLVAKDDVGYGKRSWRYSMYVVDGEIKQAFIEEGFEDNAPGDPFEVSDAETMLEYLKKQE